jgi:hypothetical protein
MERKLVAPTRYPIGLHNALWRTFLGEQKEPESGFLAGPKSHFL